MDKVAPWIRGWLYAAMGHPVWWTPPAETASWLITYDAATGQWHATRTQIPIQIPMGVQFLFSAIQDPRGSWMSAVVNLGSLVQFPVEGFRALPQGWDASPAAAWGNALAAAGSRPLETTEPLTSLTGESRVYRLHHAGTDRWEFTSRLADSTGGWQPEPLWDGRIVTLPWRVTPTKVWNLTIAP